MLKIKFLSLFFILAICTNANMHAVCSERVTTIGTPNSSTPNVAINKHDEAVALFIHSDGVNARIQSAIKPPGKSWKTLEDFVSAPGVDGDMPKVAISDEGSITGIWRTDHGDLFTVQAATFNRHTKKWSVPTDLTPLVMLTSLPLVKIDAQGNSLAVWAIFDGKVNRIQSATLKRHSTHWEDNQDLVVEGASSLDLAIDSKGNAIIVWEGLKFFVDVVIEAARLPVGSNTWIQLPNVSPVGMVSHFPKVGVDKAGNAVVVWSQGFPSPQIAGARLAFGSTTWEHTNSPSTLAEATTPNLAVDPCGNVVATWITISQSLPVILVEAATLPAHELTWRPSTTLASPIFSSSPSVVVNKCGDAVALWDADGRLQLSTLRFGRSWTTPVFITPNTITAGEETIAMSPCGKVAIAYRALTPEEVVQAIDF
jgi:hypothetical protein